MCQCLRTVNVERVLIVGGGDCGLAEEVLKHQGVRSLVQVEANPLLVKLARVHFTGINATAFNDGRFQLRSVDGSEFVASTAERFDLILVDLADPGGTSLSLLTERFFRDARGCLGRADLWSRGSAFPSCSHSRSLRREAPLGRFLLGCTLPRAGA